ncbi:MAG TPA: polysaccharide biosynthesis/export family protein [Candidatus Avibacteroides excrementipullorum]|jgi:polysaccharide export outer membrane protein|nr:polysaccharide biosynthesis/export family protein [Candidatus Avibacteroides excrementipullorum]
MEFRKGNLFVIVFLFVLASCKTYEKINYMQDVRVDTPVEVSVNQGIRIQPQDMLSIVVSSKTPELAMIFNLPVVSYQAGSEVVSGAGSQRLLGYVVDNNGEIDFPVLGKIKVAGLTRWEVQEYIKKTIIDAGLMKDLVVTVEFMNFKISIMGEVNSPGTYTINGDKVTLLEALSMARDLTIYGKRDGVYVVREENGVRTTYNVDLRSVSLFDSPVYYLRQNDVVYVEPNKVRAGQSTINENSLKSVSLWISIGSFLTSLAVLIFK